MAPRPRVADDGGVVTGPGAVCVLLVDDQDAFRSAARMVVESTDGFEVAGEAASGGDAIRMVSELAPDLVLMDVKMSGMDGLEATRRIVADHPGVRVVVLSTYEEYACRAVEAGAASFISKAAFSADRLAAVWAAVG